MMRRPQSTPWTDLGHAHARARCTTACSAAAIDVETVRTGRRGVRRQAPRSAQRLFVNSHVRGRARARRPERANPRVERQLEPKGRYSLS